MYRTYDPLGISFTIAGLYLVMTLTLTTLGTLLERRLYAQGN